MEILQKISSNHNLIKLEQVKNNQYFINECSLLNQDINIEYYKHIIQNIDINRHNENNSYILWIYDKVDLINMTKPAKIDNGNVSLPDIDIDFPINKREYIIQYIKDKYGHNKVGQMVTFGRMQGKSALREVLRVHEACDSLTMNRITKNMPDESKISDQLEESGESSIIKWVLENEPELLKDYCTINTDGILSGEYAQYFEQAIRLEGTYKSQGKHAAGIIISAEPLEEICPMTLDKNGDLIVGWEMDSAEATGLFKADILGLAILDKLMLINELLMKGKICQQNQ